MFHNEQSVAANPFSSTFLKYNQMRQQKYGQQLKLQNTNGVFNDTKVQYTQQSPLKMTQIGVDNFTSETIQTQRGWKQFQSVLNNCIVKGIQQAKNYSNLQISDYFPWLFTQKFLFEPLRTLLCALYNNFPVQLDLKKKIDNDQITQGALLAVYQSIKYNGPYIQQAFTILRSTQDKYKVYKENINSQILEWLKQVQKTIDNQKQNNGTFDSMYNALSKAGRFTKNTLFNLTDFLKITQVSDNKLSNNMNNLLSAAQGIFNGLKSYGNVIINYLYLKQAGLQQNVNGKTYFYMWNRPQIFFSAQYSFMQVYYYKNGSLTLIPQSQFNMNLIKRWTQQMIFQEGQEIKKNYQYQINTPQKIKQARKDFAGKYFFATASGLQKSVRDGYQTWLKKQQQSKAKQSKQSKSKQNKQTN